MNEKNKRGFTLVELIIVIAILGLLAAALFVAIDPAKRIGDARDAQRWSDITAILSAILTYTADVGTLPSAIDSMVDNQYYVITNGSDNAAADTVTKCAELDDGVPRVNLRPILAPGYLATIPYDPLLEGNYPGSGVSTTATTTSGYYIKKATGNRILVGACNRYASASLEVQR